MFSTNPWATKALNEQHLTEHHVTATAGRTARTRSRYRISTSSSTAATEPAARPSAARTAFLTGRTYVLRWASGKMDVAHREPPIAASTLIDPKPALRGPDRSSMSSATASGRLTKCQEPVLSCAHTGALNE